MKHMVLVITMTFMSLVIIRLYEKHERRSSRKQSEYNGGEYTYQMKPNVLKSYTFRTMNGSLKQNKIHKTDYK